MEMDTKQQLLVLLYAESKKAEPDMRLITPGALRVDREEFERTLADLEEEGYIEGLSTMFPEQYSGWEEDPFWSSIALTPAGCGCVEALFEVDADVGDEEKLSTIEQKLRVYGVPLLQQSIVTAMRRLP